MVPSYGVAMFSGHLAKRESSDRVTPPVLCNIPSNSVFDTRSGPSCSSTGYFGNLDLGNKKIAKLLHGYSHAKAGFDSLKVTRMFTLFSS